MQHYPNNSVISADGTIIGYRVFGNGPGLILLHGAMQTGASLIKLALALADSFTIYLPDRRGRGLSGPMGKSYGMGKEVEDLSALVTKTGVTNVFGLSSGAIIALQAGFILSSIKKIAIYEPPLEMEGASSPMKWVPEYEEKLARGKLASAMVVSMKGTGEKSLLTRLPNFVLIPLMWVAIQKDAKHPKQQNATLGQLIRLVHFDVYLATEMAGAVEKFRRMQPEVLLMGGRKSALFLKAGLNALERILPHHKRVELLGVGHLAAIEKPGQVAGELKRFF
jgi:pimeloyl-ACP methyl ester carboxylesterase